MLRIFFCTDSPGAPLVDGKVVFILHQKTKFLSYASAKAFQLHLLSVSCQINVFPIGINQTSRIFMKYFVQHYFHLLKNYFFVGYWFQVGLCFNNKRCMSMRLGIRVKKKS